MGQKKPQLLHTKKINYQGDEILLIWKILFQCITKTPQTSETIKIQLLHARCELRGNLGPFWIGWDARKKLGNNIFKQKKNLRALTHYRAVQLYLKVGI